jgi:uncharacterized protein (DUF488 family)
MDNQIFTIGHSTRSIEEFINMLKAFKINALADVRSYPGSKRFPHFNKENISRSLEEAGISYLHIGNLGGRRTPKKDSKNSVWKNQAFKGYADYMETDQFAEGINELLSFAKSKNCAYMCSEAVWWKCHRSMISDYLKAKGWKVIHIVAPEKNEEHPFTSPAKIKQGDLFYGNDL